MATVLLETLKLDNKAKLRPQKELSQGAYGS